MEAMMDGSWVPLSGDPDGVNMDGWAAVREEPLYAGLAYEWVPNTCRLRVRHSLPAAVYPCPARR